MTALQVSTVLSCVNIISNAVSSLRYTSLKSKSKDGRVAKKIAHNHPLYDLLAHEPNCEMSSVSVPQDGAGSRCHGAMDTSRSSGRLMTIACFRRGHATCADASGPHS